MLEERVATLEARPIATDPVSAAECPPEQHEHVEDASNTVPNGPTSSGHFAAGVGLLSSCAAAEPHYFGYSSGLTLAHFVEAAIESNDTPTNVSLPILADRPFSSQIPTSRTPLAPVPTKANGGRFIRAYLATIHPLYPFLDRKSLWNLHGNAIRDGRSLHGSDLAKLHLVYAIGSRCLQLLNSDQVGRNVPEGHFLSAMEHIPEVIKVTSLRSIEITLLLALHSMRSPSG